MTKEVLEQYADLLKEISKLEKRIEKLKKQSPMTSDVVQNGYKRHAVIRGYDCDRARKLHFLENVLEERKNMVSTLVIEIETWISSIKKSSIRQIFEHRYIDKMKWFEIAQVMDLDNEDVPRKRHDRYLEKNL